MALAKRAFLIYLGLLQAAGCAIYFFGFFPVKHTVSDHDSTDSDLPLLVNQQKLETEFLYRKRIPKLVIMLIDALRFDFVWGDNSAILFPYLSTQLDTNCLLRMRVESPTVTLPRIKSLVTGTVPSFYDVIRNFGSTELREDSFIRQATRRKLKTIFFGDSTWLKLFPDSFERHDGTSSFFATDYTEVDQNVTRHLAGELATDDWDIMILHYLGLDHIGHIEGPKSALIKPKLHEMDEIIQRLHWHLSKTTDKGVLIICGDHGMKDSGGHGGSSWAEIIVPFVLLNYNCSEKSRNEESKQIDAAPIISALLGLPIPSGSLGTLNLNQLQYFGVQSALYTIYYNTLRLWENIATNQLKDELFEEYEKGKFLYEKCIKNKYQGSACAEAANSFTVVQNEISSSGVKESITFEVYLMILGIFLLVQNVLLVFTRPRYSTSWQSVAEYLIPIFLLLAFLHSIGCFLSQSETLICLRETSSIPVTLVVLLVASYNTYLLRNVNIFVEMKIRQFHVILPTFLHSLTIISSSLIEEEHEFWYFLCSSLLIYLLWIERGSKKQVWVWGPLALTTRFLRSINQVGDKWSSLSDLSDWFSMTNNSRALTGFCILGLILLWICDIDLTKELKSPGFSVPIEASLTFLQLVFVFLQKVATGRCSIWIDYPLSSGVTEASIFWYLTLLKTVISVIINNPRTSNSTDTNFHRIINLILRVFIVIVAFLVRPYNLIFLPSIYIWCKASTTYFHRDDLTLTFVHFWIGANFYFMMGNWNNLASIDVSVGYTGLRDFSMVITGFYLWIHTYAAPILSLFLLLNSLSYRQRFYGFETDVYRALLFHNGLPLLLCSALTLIHRHHLFIWTVFAPKLLFVSCQTLLVTGLVIFSALIATFCRYL